MVDIRNEDCFITMLNLRRGGVDLILTSPPYNTHRETNTQRAIDNWEGRYDVPIKAVSQEEYSLWSVKLFNQFAKILRQNGVVLWNVSYGSDGTQGLQGINSMWLSIADIIRNTPFCVADRIIWKKKSAIPNNVSPNKLTRIVEDIFVFCRKEEYKTFLTNKKIVSISKTGQKIYENIYNLIEAKNNDGRNSLNKATFSTELVLKLLEIYLPKNEDKLVYDPFGGTCTTAFACKQYGVHCVCSEISEKQCEYGRKRCI